MTEDYKVLLGIDLDEKQLSSVKTTINNLVDKERKINLDIDFNIKNAGRLADVGREIEKIQNQLKELNNVGSVGKGTSPISINSKSLETSLNKIHETIKKVQNAFGRVDKNKGVQSLLTTVSKISAELANVSKQFEGLNRNLSSLSSKDFSLNFDFGFSKNSKSPEQISSELKMLKKEAEEYEKFFEKFYSGTIDKKSHTDNKADGISRLIGQYNSRSQLYLNQLRNTMWSGEPSQKQIAAYKEYLSLIKETAAIGKIELAPVEFRLAESGEFVKVRNEADETKKQLQELFSGGINAENLHRTLDGISADLHEIGETLKGLSSGISVEGLTSSFDKLSETIEKLVSNVTLAKNALGDGLGNDVNVNTNSINNIEKTSDAATSAVIQNEKKKQEAYKTTADAVIYHAGIISRLNKAETNGRFYGSNRGTGYFGTGHYFVDSATKHELDSNGYYNKLPYTSVDISKYDNLFKATTDEVADRLHTFLANLTAFTQGSDGYDVSELFAQFKNVFGDTIMDIKEFGSRLDQLKAFMSSSSMDDRSDSVSTQFMKSLGYEGVDTRGTRFADTRYGTVIYDLKEESILQANITDELQKQGQMLEKINYAKGQVFDKDEDDRIQGIIDAQNKRREINEEFKNSFDTTGFDKADNDLLAAKNRLTEIDETIQRVQHSLNNLDREYREFSREMSMLGLDDDEILLWEDEDEWKQNKSEDYQNYINQLSQEKAELQSKIPVLEEVYNKESQLANEAYERAKQTVEQRHLKSQQAQKTANVVVQNEERKQRVHQETVNMYDKISRAVSLVRDDVNFQKSFEESNQAAQEAQRHFQQLLADEKAVVSVVEQFDNNNALQSFVVNVKRASGEIETLRYAMDKLDGEENGRFRYQSGSATDRNVEKQLETRIKKANDLQIKLDKIKTEYSDMGHTKPIKNSDYITSLDEQYEKVKKAIIDVRNADDSTFTSMISNAEKEKSALESMVKVYRNADNVSNSLKGTDFASGVQIRIEELGKFKAQASDFPQMTKTIKELDRAIEGVGDKSSLDSFTDQLKVARAELAKVKAETVAANRQEKVGIDVSGATSRIVDIQRISPEIDDFKAQINGAEVTVESLLNDLSKVNTAGDFSVVNRRLRVFEEAAKSSGIAVTEAVTKISSVNKIKNKLSDTGFNGFEQEVSRAHIEAEKLEGATTGLESALKRLDVAMEAVYSADQANDAKRLIAANEEYELSLKQVYSQLKLNQQAEKESFNAEMLAQKKASLSSEMEIWLKENTRAAKDFGEEIRRLQASLDGLDDKGVKLVGQQFKTITKQAQAMGKTGLTVFDKLKAKAKEYMAYLSAAELFMYAEQALREMFEQVKLIDSAMTELKKVTNETDAVYDEFLTNAADRAKEIGTTIDGLVSSTADFARLGYGFQDAQGLAEVANIYAVVGDEIEGVEGATKSLISTMAAFKDQADGMNNTDFAMSIVDKFNEIGNNFAISSGGIGEALERSASSLDAANNTLDESIALITAANTVVQDPEQVGRLMPTKKVAISVKLQRWTRPRKDFISIFDIHQLGRMYIF